MPARLTVVGRRRGGDVDVAVGVDPFVDLLRPPRREGEQDGDGDGDTLNDPNKIVYTH